MGRMGRGGGLRGGRAGGPQGGARKGSRLPPPIQERLNEALAKAQAGDHAEAGALLGKLADKAEEAGRHRMALHMALRAAFNCARAGDAAGCAEWVERAARFGAPIRNQAGVGRRFGRLVHHLRAAGLEDRAAEVEAAALGHLGLSRLPRGEGAATVNRERRRKVPNSCPTCGASVAIEAVEFDDDGADCPSCGGELLP